MIIFCSSKYNFIRSIFRLVAYDKKQNFGQTQKQLEPEYNTSLKDPETYFDVNADSKVIGTIMDHLTDYLARYDKQLDKQIQRFYSERTIRYSRMSLDNETTYIASSCYAKYKKGISYDIDILFDKAGAITEAQCECPACSDLYQSFILFAMFQWCGFYICDFC